ncbi:MAG: type IV pilus assembly protein PilM [Parcubacteria group bacterium Gr01-1014_33]|nr:MAG: type IV pilus assembly protein PilM [Parcubacteria group bacterium Gr01-1014_33]
MGEKISQWIESLLRMPVAAGLDISDQSIKYAKFYGKRKYVLEAWGEIIVPEGIIVNGEIQKEEELTRIFTEWIKGEGKKLRSSFFTVSLPEEKGFVRMIQLPKVRQDEIHNAIRWEIEANIPMAQEELFFDYEIIQPLEDHLNHFDVMLTAFPKAIVESYVRVLKKSGIKISALELESQAIVRSSVADLKTKAACAVVDMGRFRTSFIIFAGGAIFFTTTVELGGKAFEENIARAMGVSMERARALKISAGLNKRVNNGAIYAALVPSIAVLADELERTIEYYQNHTAHAHGAASQVEIILLTGGDANLFGVDTYLASVLKVPVTRINPFLAFSGETRESRIFPITRRNALGFAASLGLALRGIRDA